MGDDTRATVILPINNTSLSCLIDGGSCKSLLRAERFKELCDNTHRSRFLRPTVELQRIAGGRLAILGETEVIIDQLNVPLTVTVVSGMKYDLLLGDPSIREGQGILDYGRGTFNWYNTSFPLELGPVDPVATVLVNAITSEMVLSGPSTVAKGVTEPCDDTAWPGPEAQSIGNLDRWWWSRNKVRKPKL